MDCTTTTNTTRTIKATKSSRETQKQTTAGPLSNRSKLLVTQMTMKDSSVASNTTTGTAPAESPIVPNKEGGGGGLALLGTKSTQYTNDDINKTIIKKEEIKQIKQETEEVKLENKETKETAATVNDRTIVTQMEHPVQQASVVTASLALEKFNNECLLNLHGKASEHNDVHMCDYLEGKFLGEQVESINEIGKMVSNLKRCGDGLGEYLFDKHHFSQ